MKLDLHIRRRQISSLLCIERDSRHVFDLSNWFLDQRSATVHGSFPTGYRGGGSLPSSAQCPD